MAIAKFGNSDNFGISFYFDVGYSLSMAKRSTTSGDTEKRGRGRPPGIVNSRQVIFKAPPEWVEAAREVAESEGVKLPVILRGVVDAWSKLPARSRALILGRRAKSSSKS